MEKIADVATITLNSDPLNNNNKENPDPACCKQQAHQQVWRAVGN